MRYPTLRYPRIFPRLVAMALIPPFMHLNKIRWELSLSLYQSQHEMLRNTPILTNTVFGCVPGRDPAQPAAGWLGLCMRSRAERGGLCPSFFFEPHAGPRP